MTNEDDSIDGTIETLAKGQTKEGSEVKGRQQEYLTDVGGAGHFAINNHGNDIDNDDNEDDNDDNYDDGRGASDYEVGGGGAGVTGGNDGVGDGDGYGVGGQGNGEGDDDDVVVDDSGDNSDRGGVEGGLLKKGDDKVRNGAYLSENSDGNGIAVELDSDHELVATAEDRSEETILVSNTFPLSVH